MLGVRSRSTWLSLIGLTHINLHAGHVVLVCSEYYFRYYMHGADRPVLPRQPEIKKGCRLMATLDGEIFTTSDSKDRFIIKVNINKNRMSYNPLKHVMGIIDKQV